MILWLMPPLVFFVVMPHQRYKLSLMVGGYWVGKVLFPPVGLSTGFPASLQGIPISSPFWVSAAALSLITLAAAAIGLIGWGRTPAAVRYAAYFLTDALLTFAIFGVRVELFGS